MQKSIFFFSIIVLFTTGACGLTTNFGFQTITGSGDITNESRHVSGFERVEICCGMELYLTQGETESLEIEADDNLMDEIVTTVVNGRLEIKYKRTNNINYLPTQAVRVYVTMVDVQGVSLSGGGNFESDSINSEVFDLNTSGGSDAWIAKLVSSDIKMNFSGGGKLEAGTMQGDQVTMGFSGGSDAHIENLAASSIDVSNSGGGEFDVASCEAEKLEVDASGGGIIKISGIVIEQDISLSGGSSYKAKDLQSQHTTFTGSGGGDSTIWVTETLSVKLSGGSNLAYYGEPQIFNPNLSGDSGLNPLGPR